MEILSSWEVNEIGITFFVVALGHMFLSLERSSNGVGTSFPLLSNPNHNYKLIKGTILGKIAHTDSPFTISLQKFYTRKKMK